MSRALTVGCSTPPTSRSDTGTRRPKSNASSQGSAPTGSEPVATVAGSGSAHARAEASIGPAMASRIARAATVTTASWEGDLEPPTRAWMARASTNAGPPAGASERAK